MSRKRAITTLLSQEFIIMRLSITFEDVLPSPRAPQVLPYGNTLRMSYNLYLTLCLKFLQKNNLWAKTAPNCAGAPNMHQIVGEQNCRAQGGQLAGGAVLGLGSCANTETWGSDGWSRPRGQASKCTSIHYHYHYIASKGKQASALRTGDRSSLCCCFQPPPSSTTVHYTILNSILHNHGPAWVFLDAPALLKPRA